MLGCQPADLVMVGLNAGDLPGESLGDVRTVDVQPPDAFEVALLKEPHDPLSMDISCPAFPPAAGPQAQDVDILVEAAKERLRTQGCTAGIVVFHRHQQTYTARSILHYFVSPAKQVILFVPLSLTHFEIVFRCFCEFGRQLLRKI
jgi:hypothetical protein